MKEKHENDETFTDKITSKPRVLKGRNVLFVQQDFFTSYKTKIVIKFKLRILQSGLTGNEEAFTDKMTSKPSVLK